MFFVKKTMYFKKINLYVALFAIIVVSSESYIVNPGPTVIATKGEVWPKPQFAETSEKYFILQPHQLSFNVTGYDCQTLQNVLLRYQKIISRNQDLVKAEFHSYGHDRHKKQWLLDDNFTGYFDQLTVHLSTPCNDTEYPTFENTEDYTLNLTTPESSLLHSTTIWGIMRGLETFSQLIYLADDGISLRINATNITDYPRFRHRGLMLDTSRHFIPLEQIYDTLDAMSYNKLNVFHWHIVDDQSFPYVSKKFPELSEKGAYHINMVYTPENVQSVIEYSRERGIRVIPEFDTPGHTRSWGVSHLEILTPCYETSDAELSEKSGQYGPIDPSQNETYVFVKELFEEVGSVFPDKYMHIGGDEVGFECWQSNPDIKKFMEKLNITDDYAALESYYMQKLIDVVDGTIGSNSIVWEEVFSNGVTLPSETIVHVWKQTYLELLNDVTKSGRRALLSSCWYLDHLSSGGDWEDFYVCDPQDFVGNETQKSLVIGGEACMWSEVVNRNNVISRVWPRACAAAERLWSNASVTDLTEASKRLEEHTCRLNRRGIGAQPPNGAGFCIL